MIKYTHQRATGGLGYLSSTYNRVRLGSNPRWRIMNIEDIIKTCKPILGMRSPQGDTRCFFEDEANKILYVFGPAKYLRQGFESSSQQELVVVEFEGGPYIGIGDEILSGKYALSMGLTYDHDVPLLSINYDIAPIKKKKKKRKNK
jgi:hypothetical protein